MCNTRFIVVLILLFSTFVVPATAEDTEDMPIRLKYLLRGTQENHQEKWPVSQIFTSLNAFQSASSGDDIDENDRNEQSRSGDDHPNKAYFDDVSGSDSPRRRRRRRHLKPSHSEKSAEQEGGKSEKSAEQEGGKSEKSQKGDSEKSKNGHSDEK
jgi:hypothetical protein